MQKIGSQTNNPFNFYQNPNQIFLSKDTPSPNKPPGAPGPKDGQQSAQGLGILQKLMNISQQQQARHEAEEDEIDFQPPKVVNNEQRFIVDSENIGKNIEGQFLSPHAALKAAYLSFKMMSKSYSD